MAQPLVIEAKVAGEERHGTKSVQQGNDGSVLGASATHLMSDLTHRNAPVSQELALVL